MRREDFSGWFDVTMRIGEEDPEERRFPAAGGKGSYLGRGVHPQLLSPRRICLETQIPLLFLSSLYYSAHLC